MALLLVKGDWQPSNQIRGQWKDLHKLSVRTCFLLMPCPANLLEPSLPIPTVFGLSRETANKTQHPLNGEFLPQAICHLGNGTELIKLVSCKASSK